MTIGGAIEREAKARLGITLRAKWHLDTLLGIGGVAAVYAATHRNGKRGAVKIMHRSACDPESNHRFLCEGRIANHVQHDGVVSFLDDDLAEDGSPFLVMELLDGESFGAHAARTGNRLASDIVLLLVDQVLDALAAAHDRGIIHRDIKPENLFVTTDARIKVLDFGIAHLTDSFGAQLRVTQLGTTMGTPAFMSPEQARGRWDVVGPKSDLWSLGATMFTLLTGQLVHEDSSMYEVLAATITKPVRSLETALPGAPPTVVALVNRALRRDPVDRWPDARAMQRAVRAAYHATTGTEIVRPPVERQRVADGAGPEIGHRSEPVTLTPLVPTNAVITKRGVRRAPRRRRRWPLLAGAAAIVLGAAAFGNASKASIETHGGCSLVRPRQGADLARR